MKNIKILVFIFALILIGYSLSSVNGLASCTDTDGGERIYLKGKTYGQFTNGNSYENWDFCSGDGKQVAEQFCLYDSGTGGNYPNGKWINCPNGCIEGKCVESTSCTDTDGGINYKTKGIVTTSYNGNPSQWQDGCKNELEIGEYYCLNNWVASIGINCKEKYGDGWACRDGSCQENKKTCTDSDLGKDYKTAGSVTTNFNGKQSTWQDLCKSETEVNEAYCSDNWIAWTSYDCKSYGSDYICTNNACQKGDQNFCELWGRKVKPGDDFCFFKSLEDCNYYLMTFVGTHYYYCQIEDKNAVFWSKFDDQCNMLQAKKECDNGKSCYKGKCLNTCETDSDCKEDEKCEKGDTGVKTCVEKSELQKCESCVDWAKNIFKKEENDCEPTGVLKQKTWFNPLNWILNPAKYLINTTGLTNQNIICPVYFFFGALLLLIFIIIILIILMVFGITFVIVNKIIRWIVGILRRKKK